MHIDLFDQVPFSLGLGFSCFVSGQSLVQSLALGEGGSQEIPFYSDVSSLKAERYYRSSGSLFVYSTKATVNEKVCEGT